MARRIHHQLVDDLDGTVCEPGQGETVLFSLDGISYEIDLTEENAAVLRSTLTRYTDRARRLPSPRRTRTGSSDRKRRRSGQQDYSDVREWARQNGYQVSERGRVPAAVMEAYERAH